MRILIIGGGLAGCTAALELSKAGFKVTMVEKLSDIGGKVRYFGCKATDSCNDCGVCIAGNLWDSVNNDDNIDKITNSKLIDLQGSKGNFTAFVKQYGKIIKIESIQYVIIAAGYSLSASKSFGNLELSDTNGVLTGSMLERLLLLRDTRAIFDERPSSIAFIQCFGSRDAQENALYCSRVCCGYSTRAARVIRKYYPDCSITIFFMDLQEVEQDNYFEILNNERIEFIRCRPAKIKDDGSIKIIYEKPDTGEVVERSFDKIVLSEGIHPGEDNMEIAELCLLSVDQRGFLKTIREPRKTGVYLAGCASGPKNIQEAYDEALTAAREIISSSSK